jgi:glucosamine-6-phosphate deaminase
MNQETPVRHVHKDRTEMGAAAAGRFHQWIEETLARQARCRLIFACAPSQDEFLRALAMKAQAAPALWKRVDVFHMDDYVGLADDHPQAFRNYLRRHFLDHVPTGSFQPIGGAAPNAEAEAARYADLLAAGPIDAIALGIGENGHIAFNDPPAADFHDPVLVKVVELDAACRQQQVNDGCFSAVREVPRLAITLTLPVFARAGALCCIVPGVRKARAVRTALTDPIGSACPATILRTHPNSQLFLDQESASLLSERRVTN